jgi:hypothetical protein
MKKKKSSRRLVLNKVDILSVNEGGRPRSQVKVILAHGDERVTGRAFVPPGDEEMLQSVALATLQALKLALPEGVKFVLKSAVKMRPRFLNDPLLVVIIDCEYDDLNLNLTGACIASDEKVEVGVASAVLDATNRLVSFLLESYTNTEADYE